MLQASLDSLPTGKSVGSFVRTPTGKSVGSEHVTKFEQTDSPVGLPCRETGTDRLTRWSNK